MQKRHIIKSCGILLLSGMLTWGTAVPGIVTNAATSSVQQKLDEATKSKKENLEKLNEAKAQREDAITEKDALDTEISILEDELSGIDAIIADADARIAEKQAQITQYEADIEKEDEAFRKRLRAMDEINVSTYIDILLEAESLSDFLVRMETLREISEHDQAIIDQMVTLKNGVVQSKQEIEASKAEQEEARSLVADKKAALDAKLAEKTQFIEALKNDMEAYEAAIAEAEEQEQALKAQLTPTLSRSSSNAPAFISNENGGAFIWPLPSSHYITSQFSTRTHPVYGVERFHSGIDIGGSYGSAVYASAGGTVTLAGWNGGYGNCVVIDHGNGMATLYGHNSSLLVSAGQTVSQGQQIARVGSTGVSTGPHLHFEVLVNGVERNPLEYVG